MIIDGHVHAAGKFANAEQLVAVLDRLGVDRLALCPSLKNNTQLKTPARISLPFVSSADKYFLMNRLCRLSYRFLLKDRGDGNALVHTLAQQLPQRILQFYWLEPQAAGAIQHLQTAFARWTIHGIKLHQACHPFHYDSAVLDQVAQFAGAYQLPVFIHPHAKPDIRQLLTLARRYPTTTFIVAHLLGLEIAADYAGDVPNVYYDMSGGDVITPERLTFALETFGAERLLLGSDEPFGSLETSLARVHALDISAAQKARILGENLRMLCRLDDRCD